MRTVIGYLIFDEGKPVRRFEYDGVVDYWNNLSSLIPVSVFPTLKVARRVKRMLRSKYLSTANRFSPALNGDEKRCFELWATRAKSIRISAVAYDNPTVKDLAR